MSANNFILKSGRSGSVFLNEVRFRQRFFHILCES